MVDKKDYKIIYFFLFLVYKSQNYLKIYMLRANNFDFINTDNGANLKKKMYQ